MSDTIFSARLRQIRKALDQNQTDFACKLGIPRTSLINYEKGVSNPSADFLSSLKRIFNVSIDRFLTGEGAMIASLPINTEREIAKTGEYYKVPLLRQKVSCGKGAY
jgi:transcriptional regulator with XRE-family HTH domain